MIKVLNTILTPRSLMLVTDGSPIILTSEAPNFQEAASLVRGGDLKAVIRLLGINTEPLAASLDDKDFSWVGDSLYLKGIDEPFPPILRDKIRSFLVEGIDYTGWKNLWRKLSQNPDEVSKQSLFSWLEYYNTTIFEDGDILMYKAVNGDYSAWHRDPKGEKVYWNVGTEVKMDRKEVVLDPNSACAAGLHAATIEFAQGFMGACSCPKIIDLKVNPADVVSVPKDYKFQKVRVCRAWVLGDNKSGKWVQKTDSRKLGQSKKKVVALAKKTIKAQGSLRVQIAAKGLVLGSDCLGLTSLRSGDSVVVLYRSREDRKRKRNLFIGNAKSNQSRKYAKTSSIRFDTSVSGIGNVTIPPSTLSEAGMLQAAAPYRVRKVEGGLEIAPA